MYTICQLYPHPCTNAPKKTPLIREKIVERVRFRFSFLIHMDLQCYGYLFGKIKLIKDNHHDEVFIEKTGLIIIENSRWLYTRKGLIAIANEIIGDEENG